MVGIAASSSSTFKFQNLPKIRVLNENEQSEFEEGKEGGSRGSSRRSSLNSIGSANRHHVISGGRGGGGLLGTTIERSRNFILSRKHSLNTPSKEQHQNGEDTKFTRKYSLVESSVAAAAAKSVAPPDTENNGQKGAQQQQQHHLSPSIHRGSIQSNSSGSKASKFKSRASELIIRVPARQLKKIAKTQGIGSLQRETQHFVGVTSINGLLRIYRSRGVFRLCWIFVTALSLTFLFWQVCKLVTLYNSRPTVSQVSFLLPENGLSFPAITICSHNPIRRAYVEQVNGTGLFSRNLLDYVLFSFMEPQYLLSVKSPMELELIDEEWKEFLHYSEKRFSVNGFFWNASTTCKQMLKFCSFGGREFDCCKYAKGILTDIGKCYQLYFGDTDQTWLKRQVQAGMNNGLQIIADAHIEEQIGSTAIGSGHAFADNFENGFRYYVHDQHAMPYLSTEGISVSPGTKVYSAISPTKYFLLSHEEWGNCTHQWPTDLQKVVTDGIGPMALEENLPYSSLKCKTLCQAKHFQDHCGCSPFIYNIEEYYKVCSPYETLMCLNKTMMLNNTAEEESNGFANIVDMPSCAECKIECHRSVYHIYNSYSQGFTRSFITWLHRRNVQWSPGHVRSNFVSINIFYRDMCYTEYKQVQSVSMTEILSDIGGNMGLFLGMSLISLTEFATFLCKITWLFISKARREHMLAKKRRDEDREKRLQATLDFAVHQRKMASGIGRMMSQVAIRPGTMVGGGDGEGGRRNSLGGAFQRLRHIYTSTRRKGGAIGVGGGGAKVAPVDTANLPPPLSPPNVGTIELGLAADTLPDEQNFTSRKRTRSNSVIANLFKARRESATSIASSKGGGKHRRDFVESVIESRLHGDAGRAARKSCSSSSSSISASSLGTSDAEEEEEDECGDKVVELKIDLDSLQKGGDHVKKRVAYLKPIYRRKSAYAMRMGPREGGKHGNGVQHGGSGGGVRRASTFAYPKEMQFQVHGSRRSSLEPTPTSSSQCQPISHRLVATSLLIGQLKPTIDAQTQIAVKSPTHRRSIVATMSALFDGASRHDLRKESDPEAPNLSRIAQKHSIVMRKQTGGAGQTPVTRSVSQQ